MSYDEMLKEIDANNLSLHELDMHEKIKGLCIGKNIILNKRLQTFDEKSCVLAEEIGHYKTTVGDITDDTAANRKQELKARAYAYDMLIGLDGILKAWQAGCADLNDAAEFLGVTQYFLECAIAYYTQKYGKSVKYKDNEIVFIPCLCVNTDCNN